MIVAYNVITKQHGRVIRVRGEELLVLIGGCLLDYWPKGHSSVYDNSAA